MNRRRLSNVGHGELLFWNPIGNVAMEAVLADVVRAARGDVARVLDVGCGRAEALLRLAERTGAHGVGVDTDPHAAATARRAAERLPQGRIEIRQAEFHAEDFAPGSFDAALCVGATHACGGFEETLRAFRRVLRAGGAAVVGEGHWLREPDPDYLGYLGEAPGDTKTLPELVEAAGRAGFDVAAVHDTPRADFDRYEELYAGNVERFAASHPDDPDVPAMLAHIRAWRAAYLRWGCTTMGFALFVLRDVRK